MNINDFKYHLESKLSQPLPGKDSHRNLMSSERLLIDKHPDFSTKESAVLLVFYPDKGQVYMPLILRPQYDGTHGGQMALPGGKMETQDESLVRTALREAEEEIGIKALDVNVLGKLSQVFIPVSNYLVQPVVGILDYKPEFFPDSKEVQAIFPVDFLYFAKNKKVEHKPMKFGKELVQIHFVLTVK